MLIPITQSQLDRPKRIQRKRTKGWRMPPNTVYVGRPSVFGNLMNCNMHGCPKKSCKCCEPFHPCCVDIYEEYVRSGLKDRPSSTGITSIALDALAGYPRRKRLIEALSKLRGKNLACWCPLDKPCHADILLEIANQL